MSYKRINKLHPVKKKKLYEDIVLQIQDLIKKERLKVGDRLPPERELALTFKVSRNSVRQALRALEEKNILKRRLGAGTYANIDSDKMVIEPLAKAVFDERNRLSEIFQFRRLIEPQIAWLAAKNISIKNIKELEKILQKQKRELAEGKKAKELDNAFHLSLARASNNKVLFSIIQTLNNILDETREEFLQTEKRRLKSFEGHHKILEAILQKNPKLARNSMNEHLKKIEKITVDKMVP